MNLNVWVSLINNIFQAIILLSFKLTVSITRPLEFRKKIGLSFARKPKTQVKID